ncbi:MAG: IMPACT family member YigZ [Firmicutes bacterium ADurb.Bin182]|nr:MAG: IMPACT family member YigZ [Firmicutes bacterium ADurb.Bin182]
MNAYKTVKKESKTEFIINRSRFIGRCFPIETEDQAAAILADVRKLHYDASHNCFAYAVGRNGAASKFSDDGEPGGTAGLPIMEVLRHKGITNVLCVVTRYFGGVLLGAGGLARAYSRSAADAVEAAGIVQVKPGSEFELLIDYDQYSRLEVFLRERTNIIGCDFSDKIIIRIILPVEKESDFIAEVRERSSGRVKAAKICERYMTDNDKCG